jgi:transposase-like protein
MKQTKKRYSPEFKARVAIEALKEHLTLSELVSKFGVNSSLIYRWKQEFISQSAEIFST